MPPRLGGCLPQGGGVTGISAGRSCLEVLLLVSVQCNEYEQQRGESPERRSTIADQWQRDSDNRHQTYGHADVYEEMHEYAARYAISVYSGKSLSASFGILYYPADQEDI